jgi:hypothetical protein
MEDSHEEGSDEEKYPKRPRMNDQLNKLEKIVEKMMTSLCKHGEKVEAMEVEMSQSLNGFNFVVRE